MKERKMKENRFYHHEVKLQLNGARIKHFTTANQPLTFHLTKLYMILQNTLTSRPNIGWFSQRQPLFDTRKSVLEKIKEKKLLNKLQELRDIQS